MTNPVDYKSIRVTTSSILLRAIDVIDGAEFEVETKYLLKYINDIRFLCDDIEALCKEGEQK